MMDDLISRKQAIDALCSQCTVDKPETCSTIQKGDNWCEEVYILQKVPSAQPEQIWILCDERMPEEYEWIGTKKFGTTMSDEVYVTFENSKGERFTKHLHFHNGELSRYDKQHMDVWYKDYKPIAWMPLPKPYAERRTDE